MSDTHPLFLSLFLDTGCLTISLSSQCFGQGRQNLVGGVMGSPFYSTTSMRIPFH
jgi:hypothetical protein